MFFFYFPAVPCLLCRVGVFISMRSVGVRLRLVPLHAQCHATSTDNREEQKDKGGGAPPSCTASKSTLLGDSHYSGTVPGRGIEPAYP